MQLTKQHSSVSIVIPYQPSNGEKWQKTVHFYTKKETEKNSPVATMTYTNSIYNLYQGPLR